MWAVLKALHLHTQTSCFYSLCFLATSVWRNRSSCGSSLRERWRGALPVQHPGQSRPGWQGKSTHKFTSKWISSFCSLTKMFFLAFTPTSAGARNPTALRSVARLFSSSPGSLPGRLPCGRKEPWGRESAADCVCSGLCGHRGVLGGAPGQCRGQWQGEEHSSKWMQDFFWHNTIFVRLLIWHVIKCWVCVVCLFQDGHTALHLAVRRCQVEVVRCLLRHHCHVDQQDRHGNTPLHIACKDGNLPIVMAICSANASLDLPNKVSATN